VNKNYALCALPCVALLFTLSAIAQPPPSPQQFPSSSAHKAIPLDDTAADSYEGYYQIGPQRAVHYWREGDHFYFGAVGTPQRTETFPETPTRFFFANPAVTFTFNVGADGKVSSLTINQAGREIVAPRIDEALAISFPPAGAAATAKAPVTRTWTVMADVIPKALTAPTVGTLDYWPCFSPDGKTVLFSRSEDGGKTWALFRVPAVGGKPEAFAKLPVSATRASWSGKTGRIVFNGDAPDGKGSGIWVIDADGSNGHPIATGGVMVPSYPSWYPDGKTIGFGDAARNILYRSGIDGGTPIAITEQDKVLSGMSSVSPDGKWVAFAGQKNTGQAYSQDDNQIWLVDDKGISRTVEAQPLQGRTPSWSPDGRRLAFESNRGSPNGFYAVFIMDSEGTGLVQVTDYALNANHPVFSPDGQKLVFAAGDPAKGATNIAVITLPIGP
jgi:Tol biopolymer transport system component